MTCHRLYLHIILSCCCCRPKFMVETEHLDKAANGLYISHVVRKPVFGVSDQVRLKPACSATEATLTLEILDIASIGIVLFKQLTTKVLIRLRKCADWRCAGLSAPLLFAYGINRFYHDVAQL